MIKEKKNKIRMARGIWTLEMMNLILTVKKMMNQNRNLKKSKKRKMMMTNLILMMTMLWSSDFKVF
jgi:EamA domain-containing membrane protein RarD